jgi:ATP-dependent RNA helicase RhlB
MDFRELDLPEPVLRGIEAVGFVTCTPIQEAALPVALKGKDVAGQSQTGTGKTAAFLIAAFTRLLTRPVPARRGPRMLIVAPTRELAVQIELWPAEAEDVPDILMKRVATSAKAPVGVRVH